MRHRTSRRFWQAYDRLPSETQLQADRAYESLKQDPSHSSLSFKSVGRFWSVWVGLHYWALAVKEGDDFAWFWIGTHAKYDRLIG